MERLTKRTYNPCDECEYSYSKRNEASEMCKFCEFNDYVQADRKGFLLRLPCAVGTPVWTIMCGINGKNPMLFRQDFELSIIQHWGKAVFLTKEEAEKALAERNANEKVN